jgi:hypothetical protein
LLHSLFVNIKINMFVHFKQSRYVMFKIQNPKHYRWSQYEYSVSLKKLSVFLRKDQLDLTFNRMQLPILFKFEIFSKSFIDFNTLLWRKYFTQERTWIFWAIRLIKSRKINKNCKNKCVRSNLQMKFLFWYLFRKSMHKSENYT